MTIRTFIIPIAAVLALTSGIACAANTATCPTVNQLANSLLHSDHASDQLIQNPGGIYNTMNIQYGLLKKKLINLWSTDTTTQQAQMTITDTIYDATAILTLQDTGDVCRYSFSYQPKTGLARSGFFDIAK